MARVAAALEAGGLQEEAAVAPGMAPEALPAGSEEKMVPGVAPGTSRLGNIATAEVCVCGSLRACCFVSIALQQRLLRKQPMQPSTCRHTVLDAPGDSTSIA